MKKKSNQIKILSDEYEEDSKISLNYNDYIIFVDKDLLFFHSNYFRNFKEFNIKDNFSIPNFINFINFLEKNLYPSFKSYNFVKEICIKYDCPLLQQLLIEKGIPEEPYYELIYNNKIFLTNIDIFFLKSNFFKKTFFNNFIYRIEIKDKFSIESFEKFINYVLEENIYYLTFEVFLLLEKWKFNDLLKDIKNSKEKKFKINTQNILSLYNQNPFDIIDISRFFDDFKNYIDFNSDDLIKLPLKILFSILFKIKININEEKFLNFINKIVKIHQFKSIPYIMNLYKDQINNNFFPTLIFNNENIIEIDFTIYNKYKSFEIKEQYLKEEILNFEKTLESKNKKEKLFSEKDDLYFNEEFFLSQSFSSSESYSDQK